MSEQKKDASQALVEDEEEADEEQTGGIIVRTVRWLDSRLGLSYPLLRPVPQYSINPFYWLGALTVVAFVIQVVTGTIMLFWYVPDPTSAYSSTSYIFSSVVFGRFLETIHLYGAYAMILLAFMHMMRNYFVSSHKRPREVMWIFGMLMGFVTLGFGFTGYLLPWTVVSVDATNVGLGTLSPLPPPLYNLISGILGTAGGQSSELLHFFSIHIIILPAAMLLLLFGKMYMLEAHGIARPAGPLTQKQRRLIPLFPDVTVYLLEISALFGVALLVIAAAFPYTLPAEYSVAASQAAIPQPDWYFLWIYQVLKIQAFEGTITVGNMQVPALAGALTIITIFFIVLLVMPFLDRGGEKRMANRPKFIILGIILVAELIILSYWGYVTPGVTIPNEEAAIVLGGTALLIALVFAGVYKLMFRRLVGKLSSVPTSSMTIQRAQIWTGTFFAVLLGVGSLAIAESIGSVVQMVVGGITTAELGVLTVSLAALGAVVFGTIYLIYRLDLANGTIKRRVQALEIGWENET